MAQPLKFGFGQSVSRKEDDHFLRGLGRYVADIAPRETLHAVVLRSPHAHARFQIDAAQALAMPGEELRQASLEMASYSMDAAMRTECLSDSRVEPEQCAA